MLHNENTKMINIRLTNETFERTYLKKVDRFQYESLLSFVFELFHKHHFEDKEVELFLLDLLSQSGYSSIERIPILELQIIADYFLENRDQYKVDYDEEKLTYLLLAAIQKNDIITIVDNAIITDINAPLSIHNSSTVSFIYKKKIETITFKTL